MDLKSLSLAELRRLAGRIEKEITKKELGDKKDLLGRLRKMAEEQGFDFNDLLGVSSPKAVAASKPVKPKADRKQAKSVKKAGGALKFRHPEDPSIAWTGHGRKPNWVIQWLNDGKSLDALRIGQDPASVPAA